MNIHFAESIDRRMSHSPFQSHYGVYVDLSPIKFFPIRVTTARTHGNSGAVHGNAICSGYQLAMSWLEIGN